MDATVTQTNYTASWFFLLYRFLVGVLFSQLAIGILIATISEAKKTDGSCVGQVAFALKDILRLQSAKEAARIVKDLGVPATYVLELLAALGDTSPDTTTSNFLITSCSNFLKPNIPPLSEITCARC